MAILKAGEKTFLVSPDHKEDIPDGNVIILRPCFPLSVFGYGWHSTTQNFIRHMELIDFSGKNVLDIGTGCGILALLASKLGAYSVLGIDTNSQAIENSKLQSEANKIVIDFECQSYMDLVSSFDIVLANLDFPEIELDKIRSLVKLFGILIRIEDSNVIREDF